MVRLSYVFGWPLFFLLEDASFFPVILDDEFGSGVGDAQLFRCFIDGVVLQINHFNESESLLL